MKIKQKMVRILTGILTMILVLSSITFVSAVDKEEEIDKLIEAQARAVEANEVLMQYFFVEGCGIVYPDYFAGRYIEDNIFHIRLAAPTDEELAGLKNLLSGYEDVVVYEYGDFSRTFLQNYADEIASELKEQGVAVASWGVDDKTGDVNIGVLSEDIHTAKEMIEIAQTYSPRSTSPKIVIEEGGYIMPSSRLIGGSRIRVGNETRSIGVCGYYNGYPAIVSCGHGEGYINASVKINDFGLGHFVEIQYESGEIGDYSIIKLNDQYADKVSHKIGDSINGLTTVDGFMLSPSVGTYVTRYGQVTGYSCGTVTRVDHTVPMTGGETIRGLTEVFISEGEGGLPGDSGGPYLAGTAFCGVHSGSSVSNNNYTFFTPYSVVRSAGFVAITEHDCTQWTNSSVSYHSGYCTMCEETVYEAHSEYWNHLFGRCTRCGRTGQVPFDP